MTAIILTRSKLSSNLVDILNIGKLNFQTYQDPLGKGINMVIIAAGGIYINRKALKIVDGEFSIDSEKISLDKTFLFYAGYILGLVTPELGRYR